MKVLIRNSILRLNARIFPPRLGKRVIALHETRDVGRFRAKMEWLRAHYDVVPLAELPHQAIGTRGVVALTFDDGYHSWHEVAAPILEALRLPATFFVCSGFVGLEGAEADEFS